jgi:hypothetical protein
MSRHTPRRYKEGFPIAGQLKYSGNFEENEDNKHLAKHALNNQETAGLKKRPTFVDGCKKELDLGTSNQQRYRRENDIQQILYFDEKQTCHASRSG